MDTTLSEKVALRQSSKGFFQVTDQKTMIFDKHEQIGHPYHYPAKRRRATLRSDPSRDNRMRMRRIFRPGKPQPASPPFTAGISRVASNALKNLGGLGAEPPVSFAYLRKAKFHFTLNQDTTSIIRESSVTYSRIFFLMIVELNIWPNGWNTSL